MKIVFLLFPLILLLGCKQYYLSVSQQWVDAEYLASTAVSTPDPRQNHPPVGQMLILNWRLPSEVFKKKPEIVLDLILWNYTTKQIKIPIENKMDFATYRLFNEDYESSGGILTYRAKMVTQDGQVFREWKHQLWVNLITVTEDQQPISTGDKTE